MFLGQVEVSSWIVHTQISRSNPHLLALVFSELKNGHLIMFCSQNTKTIPSFLPCLVHLFIKLKKCE